MKITCGCANTVRAFHHDSENLKKFEGGLRETGIIVSANTMGRIAISTQCDDCWRYWAETVRSAKCGFCGSRNLCRSLYSDIDVAKKNAVLPPTPSEDKLKYAATILGPNPVGIFARARRCYGRNLPFGFYVQLICRLEEMGYTPIWLGEKSTTLPCPVDHIIDFSRMDESRDLETTLGIVSLCRFTIQFWTASTRLAAMARTPFLLFESPDQVIGKGQEGFRLRLVTTGKSKLVISHYLNCLNDPVGMLSLVARAIEEMETNNWNDIIGLVESEAVVRTMIREWTQGTRISVIF